MSEIHICDMKNGVLYIPTEAKASDGEYIIAPGMRCNFWVMTESEFEKISRSASDTSDAHKRLLRHIVSRAFKVGIREQKIPVPDLLCESTDRDGYVTAEFSL